MQDFFHELAEQLHENGLSIDPPYLHGLLTGLATTPDLDISLVWPEIQQEGELQEPLQNEVIDAIDLLSEDLYLHDFEALFRADRDDEPERWIKGYFRAVELHEDQWEEWNEIHLDAGKAMMVLRALIDDQIRQVLGIDQAGHEMIREEPEIVTTLVQAIHHHFFSSPYDEEEIPPEMLPPLPCFPGEDLKAMDDDSLFRLVTTHDDRLPLEVIHECAGRGDAMVPLLLQHLETDANWDSEATSGDWWALLHAIFILGLIPGETAATALLAGFRRVTFDWENHLADWISGYWHALCRNKSDYTAEPMREIALDQSLSWYPRIHAIECVLAHAAEQGAEQLESAVDWLAALCADESESPEFRTTACGNHLLDFPREKHRPLIEQLAALGDETDWFFRSFDQNDIEHAFSDSEDHPGWRRFDDPWQFYAPDAIKQRQRRWLREEMEWEEREPLPSHNWTPVETITRDQPKIGRNDPCPCGSGKKYKKCCLH